MKKRYLIGCFSGMLVIGIILFLFMGLEKEVATLEYNVGIQENMSPEEVGEILSMSIVTVEQNGRTGKGILWSQEGAELIIVTAGHVILEEQLEVEIILESNISAIGHCLYKDSVNDVAFLSVDVTQLSSKYFDNYRIVNKESSSMVKNDDMLIYLNNIGEINEIYVMDTNIYLEDFGAMMMRCKGEAIQGMSGNGVFSQNGDLVGIICGSSQFGELAILTTTTMLEVAP